MVMNRKERHVRENEKFDMRESHDEIAEKICADGCRRKRESTRKINRLWIWLGVLLLIMILLYWLFTIGMFEDLAGYING